MAAAAIHEVGKRKSSQARVYLKKGSGKFTVNGRPMTEYFTRPTSQLVVMQPLVLTEQKDRWDISVNVLGGGPSGQAGATRHGIARALLQVDASFRPVLKKEGLLTRDAREVERKKPGRPGARKRFQFSKR
jgi:small subunit ribosomal protein S9